jgi:predicted anti-sigma-YlaC factor YlaD
VSERCDAFRADWLSAGFDLAHLEQCGDCRAWVAANERRVLALNELAQKTAPAALDQRVARELAGDRSLRLERAVGSLARLAAPSVLDAAVASLFEERAPAGDAARGERAAQALRALDLVPAPAVLDRLVAEELARPELQRAERFPGQLERLAAPEELEEKLHGSVRRKAAVRLVRGPLLALAAAAVVVWVALQVDRPQPRSYRFQVVHATSLEGLDPMARSLAESLTGGIPR